MQFICRGSAPAGAGSAFRSPCTFGAAPGCFRSSEQYASFSSFLNRRRSSRQEVFPLRHLQIYVIIYFGKLQGMQDVLHHFRSFRRPMYTYALPFRQFCNACAVWINGGQASPKSPKAVIHRTLSHPQRICPQAVDVVQNLWRRMAHRIFSQPFWAHPVKNIQGIQLRQAGIRQGRNEYIPKDECVHSRVEKEASFPHVMLWPKACIFGTLRHFSTASTSPISTAAYIILLPCTIQAGGGCINAAAQRFRIPRGGRPAA